MIDHELLAQRALLDTGVCIRGLLRERADEPKSVPCRLFCDAMIDGGRRILIAAPTLAELLRKPVNPIPRNKQIEIIPFDTKAAEQLGAHMPFARLIEARTRSGLPIDYWKYDSMIVACAIRGKATVIVTLDSELHELAASANIRAARPDEFMAAQKPLKFPDGSNFIR